MSQAIGFAAERYAKDYLTQHGLIWVESNFNCRLGEIDLIMQDQEYLVFVEVRSRSSSAFGLAIETIHYQKQQKLLKTANFYLLTTKLYDKKPTRFDVVSLDGKPPKITWVKNAF